MIHKGEQFTSSFSMCFPFISLPCNGLEQTISTILDKSGESRHSYFVPDLKGESIKSFTSEYYISCSLFVDTLNQID